MRITILFILICYQLFGQVESTQIDYNNVSAFISGEGTFFYDFENQAKGYEVPKGLGVHALKDMRFWFAAKDMNGEIYFSQGGTPLEKDIFNGPISNLNIYNTQTYLNSWEKPIYLVNQATIDKYLSNYNCSQDPNCVDNYPISNEEINQINNWPAHGDISMGQAFNLAPFLDNQEDGIYGPTQGDVPLIKGCYAAYLIQNDEAMPHTLTNTNPIGIELRIMFYQYHTSDYLNNTLLVDVEAINRSNIDYPEFMHSVAINGALGNETDDFLGCDSLSNIIYFYNSDNIDEESSSSSGYGENPPAIGIVGLHQKSSSCVPFSGNETVEEKWNLMKGYQSNGDSWIHPNGYETKYVYSGNPNNPAEWSQLSQGNTPGNVNGLLSMDFGMFHKGDTLRQSYAIIFTQDGNHLENVESLIENAMELKNTLDNEGTILCTDEVLNIVEDDKLDVEIFPNPSSGIFQIKNPTDHIHTILISDSQGRIVKEESIQNNEMIEIDLRGKQAGIYFVQVTSNNAMMVKKILIH
ncbi:MAG: T9SS type A sorting domain-containing protein [Brumimicrobium sp.]|nr:T9SS type A sorting domain-containing protein [Brumimicrobium sp.]